jgi:uncharacterized protein
MNRNHIITLLVIFVIGAIIAYTFHDEGSEENYSQQIIRERRATHDFMLASDESPLEEADKAKFDGLDYYQVDPNYRIKARFTPIKEKDILVIPTSTGEEERYIKAGHANFSLQGTEHTLLLLKAENANKNELFLAFADETSGAETYGGGRYVNVTAPKSSTIIIDFNLAYNPYCAYNASFSCPLPPKENLLSIPIPAGENVFKNYP